MLSLAWALRYIKSRMLTSSVVILILAVGVGVTGTIFSFLNAALLRPVKGMARADDLVSIARVDRRRAVGPEPVIAYPAFLEYRQHCKTVSGLSAYAHSWVDVVGEGNVERIRGAVVTHEYFDVLGLGAVVGRTFQDHEDDPATPHGVAILSHSLWQRMFGQDPGVIGRELRVNGRPATVVGILPRGFQGVERLDSVEIWMPIGMYAVAEPRLVGLHGDPSARWIHTVGRLKPGVSVNEAAAEMQSIGRQVQRTLRNSDKTIDTTIVPATNLGPGARREILFLGTVLMLPGVLVLLIAVSNSFSVLAVRLVGRRREIGLLHALGATRSQLAQPLLAEAILLSLAAGGVALLLTHWTSTLLPAIMPTKLLASSLDFSLDWRITAFTIAVSLLGGVGGGLLLAWRIAREGSAAALREATARRSLPNVRKGLVGVQIALSVVVLVLFGLLARTVSQLEGTSPGFDTRNLALMTLDPARQGYSDAQTSEFYQELLYRLARLGSGFGEATLARTPPVNIGGYGTSIARGSSGPDEDGGWFGVGYNVVAANYFKTLDLRMMAGRDFGPEDSAEAPPVVIINDELAETLWRGDYPIGKQLRITGEMETRRVVGVVRSIKYDRLTESNKRYVYLPFAQPYPAPEAPMVLHVRSLLPLREVVQSVRSVMDAIDADLSLYDQRDMREQLRLSFWAQRMVRGVFGYFGVVALFLVSVGLYGMVSHSVTERRLEFGIRAAIGASMTDIMWLVTREMLRLSLVAVVVGVVVALLVVPVLGGLLYEVEPWDMRVVSVACAIVLLLSAIGSLVPTWWGNRRSVAAALRAE